MRTRRLTNCQLADIVLRAIDLLKRDETKAAEAVLHSIPPAQLPYVMREVAVWIEREKAKRADQV